MACYRRGKKGGKPKGKPDYKPAKPLEEQCREEIGELEADFRARLTREKDRKEHVTETMFWVCIYGATQGDKLAFLKKYGLDRLDDRYISIRDFDRALEKYIANESRSGRDGHKR